MKNPQFSPADLARRREHVSTIPSVVRVSGEQLSASDGRSEDRVLRDLRFYRGLTDVRMRTSRESEWGVYIAESSKVVRRALDAGHEPLSFLTSDKWAVDLEDVLRSHPHAPAYVADDDVLEELTGFHLHRGALAVMRRPEPKPLEEILDGARRIAVLEDIVDHTNVGAAFRSAAALGVDAVLTTPRCADPLYRRSIRVSMGTVFQVPWTRLGDWPADLQELRGLGFTTAALALTPDSITIGELARKNPEKLALILGTEGDGLSRTTIDGADETVMIPMGHGVDSLNVAAASAVAFYATQ